MKTVVLDDDPTGTQSATGVDVLLVWDGDLLVDTLRRTDSVYLQTNSRAVSEADAVALCDRVRGEIDRVRREVDPEVQVVLRGDSTLRGHVFAETDVFVGDDAAVLFVPAFPQGGRTTVDGVHRLVVDGVQVPVGETEFARDPVFGYTSSSLAGFVAERGGREAVPVVLDAVRTTSGTAVADALVRAAVGAFVTPDVETDDDVVLVAAGLAEARRRGRRVVVRSAAPLAAVLAGVASDGLLGRPIAETDRAVLVVCGSHTAASTAQLAALGAAGGVVEAVTIPTAAALLDPEAAAAAAVPEVRAALGRSRVVVLQSERVRRAEDDTLQHGERVMAALVRATAAVAREVDVVVTKGGITSAAIATDALHAARARVRGQVLAGVSVWDLDVLPGIAATTVVVPGNIGGPATLLDVVAAIRRG